LIPLFEIVKTDGREIPMEPQYYYIRYSEHPTKAYCPPWEEQGPEIRPSWHKCSKERAFKRRCAAAEGEYFHHYVALVTETSGDGSEFDNGEITIQEAFEGETPAWPNYWTSPVKLTIRKEVIFGDGDEVPSQSLFALGLFARSMDDCIDKMTAY